MKPERPMIPPPSIVIGRAMTDPTPTRADWETLVAHNKALIDRNVALRERAEAAERAHLSLCEAIGIPATALSHIEYTAQLTADRRAEAAAWNDAIEAAADFLHEQAADKGNTKTPQGRTAIFYRRQIRALRRAAPTEGEA